MVTSHLCWLRFSLCRYLVHGCLHLKQSPQVVMNFISSTADLLLYGHYIRWYVFFICRKEGRVKKFLATNLIAKREILLYNSSKS